MATSPQSGRGGSGESSASLAKRQQPETLRLRSMVPTFTVNDLQRSIAWYRDGLGFFVTERWEEGGKLEGVMLKAGACHLALSQDDFGQGRERSKGVGFRILCETFQDVDALADRLKKIGGKIVEEPGNRWDTYSFTAQDPDGFKLTLAKAKE